jgi:hypothetical protein
MAKQVAQFRGFDSPNYTQVPDILFDELLPDLSGAELKVLLYIVRRTFGFKKNADSISLSQMLNGVRGRDGTVHDRGVGLSKKTLLVAINSLEERNIILTERRRSAERGDEPTTYRLNVVRGTEGGGKTTPPLGEKLHQGGGEESTPGPWGKNSPTQETELQERVGQDTGIISYRDDSLSNSKAHTRQKVQEGEPETGVTETPRRHSSRGMTRLGELLPGSPETAVGRAEPAEKGPKRPRVSQTTSAAERAPISAAQTLQRPPEATPTEAPLAAEQLAALTATIQTLSEKLGDSRHWRSNLTQARRILSASGLNANAWTGLLWSVYHRTHEQQGHLRRPMAWFFTALREEATQHSTPKSLHASFSTDPPRKSLAGQYEHLVHR